MFKRITTTLTLIATIGSVQAITVLHKTDMALLGEPLHQVTITGCNYRTVYAAYPKAALNTLDHAKQYAQPLAALSTTGLMYAGFKTASTALTNTWSHLTYHPTTILTLEVSRYACLTALSCIIARIVWDIYDTSNSLFERLIRSRNTNDSRFASHIPVTYFPDDNQEIAAINAQNPNLVWFRLSQEMIDPQLANVWFPERHQAPAPHVAAAENPVIECSLCLENIDRAAPQNNMALPCSHLFHEACIRRVIAAKPECPICAFAVNQEQ